MNIIKILPNYDIKIKRCLIIDLFSVLFLLVPNKYLMTKQQIKTWCSILFITLITVKGKDEPTYSGPQDLFIKKDKSRSLI
jgi:hypothetical protein